MLYRNWPAICQLSLSSRLLTILMATIDPETDSGKRLATAFPECFSEEPVRGPVPLSVLRHESHKLAVDEGRSEVGDAFLTSYDSLTPHGIPYIGFDINGENVASGNFPLLPAYIPKDAKVGDIIEYEGGKWVVAENNDSCEEIYLAPLECIDPGA
jgi:hypothetical protein